MLLTHVIEFISVENFILAANFLAEGTHPGHLLEFLDELLPLIVYERQLFGLFQSLFSDPTHGKAKVFDLHNYSLNQNSSLAK
jgi:hypothetical protein